MAADSLGFVGNNRIGDEVLRRAAGDTADPLGAVADFYRAQGYWSAVVRDSGGWISVAEGRLHMMRIASEGALVDPARLSHELQAVLTPHGEAGHPFAQLRFAGGEIVAPGEVRLATVLDLGSTLEINSVRVFGVTVTRTDVIAREARSKPGDIYLPGAARHWAERVRRLGLFDVVEGPALITSRKENFADLVMWVQEGKPNRFEGVVGYQPGSGDGAGLWTGVVDLWLGNLWGTARRFSGRWERVRKDESRFALGYREPWAGGLPVNLEGRLAIEQRRAFTREDLNLKADIEPEVGLTLGVSVGTESVKTDSIALLAGPRNSSTTLGLNGSFDTRTSLNNPFSGMFYSVKMAWAIRRNRIGHADFVHVMGDRAHLFPESVRRSTVAVKIDQFIPVHNNFVGFVGLRGKQVAMGPGDSLVMSASDKIRLGGAKTLRGFAEDRFSGVRMLWTNLEARYLVGPISRFFVFIDAAHIRDEGWDTALNSLVTHDSWHLGYGIGLRAQTGGGQLGVDLGWGRSDGFGEGKVHASYVSRF